MKIVKFAFGFTFVLVGVLDVVSYCLDVEFLIEDILYGLSTYLNGPSLIGLGIVMLMLADKDQ